MQERLQHLTNIRNIESYPRESVTVQGPVAKRGEITYLNTQAVIDDLSKNREPITLNVKSIVDTHGLSNVTKDAIASGHSVIAQPDGSATIPEYQRTGDVRADYTDIRKHDTKRRGKPASLQPKGIIYFNPKAAKQEAANGNRVIVLDKNNMLPAGRSELDTSTRLALERGENATVTPDGSIHAQPEELICSF